MGTVTVKVTMGVTPCQFLGTDFKTGSFYFLFLGSFTLGNQPPCRKEAQATLCGEAHVERNQAP